MADERRVTHRNRAALATLPRASRAPMLRCHERDRAALAAERDFGREHMARKRASGGAGEADP